MKTARRLPIDAHVIALNITDMVDIPEADKPYVEKVYDVFLYDSQPTEHTYCCEMTPSYFLRYVYSFFTAGPKYEELDDKKREELAEKYEDAPSEDQYHHVGNIDALVKERLKLPKGQRKYLHHGKTGTKYKDETYDEQMERLLEHYNGNHPF